VSPLGKLAKTSMAHAGNTTGLHQRDQGRCGLAKRQQSGERDRQLYLQFRPHASHKD
jgi:hypothetical protein